MFADKEVDKKVKFKLGIFDGKEPKESDLETITEILFSNLNARGEVINTDLSEIEKLKSLRILSLKGFELDAEIARIISSFPELVQLNLYECNSKEAISISIETLRNLILDHCKSINLSEVTLPENVLIVNGGTVDISKFKNSEALKELGIKNSEVINAKLLGEIQELKSLNVDGSTLDYDDVLAELKSRKVSVSNEYEYNPIR